MIRSLLLVFSIAALFVAAPAHAVLYTVNFTVAHGFGGGGSGSFSFDGSIIPSGGGTVGGLLATVDLVSDLDVVFTNPGEGNLAFDSSNAGVGYLVFDSSGNLTQWQMGGDANGIGSNPLSSAGVDFRIQALSPSEFVTVQFADGLITNSSGSTSGGTVVWSITSSSGSAPEPGAWALLSVGLVWLVPTRRRALNRD